MLRAFKIDVAIADFLVLECGGVHVCVCARALYPL